MREFIITTDNTADLPMEYIKENNLRMAYLGFNLEGTSYGENYEEQITPQEFYAKMSNSCCQLQTSRRRYKNGVYRCIRKSR